MNPNGAATQYWFMLGTTGPATPVASLAAGFTAAAVSASVADLGPNSYDTVKLIAKNGYGTTVSSAASFTTPLLPAVTAVLRAARSVVVTGAADPSLPSCRPRMPA